MVLYGRSFQIFASLEELHVNLHPSTKLFALLPELINLTEIFPPRKRIPRTREASGST